MSSMSYYHKPRSNPLDNRTIHQILDDKATKHPEKESFVFYDENKHRSSVTFQQLKDESIKFASSLLKLGLKRGDRVLLYAPNGLEFVVCWMALSRLGILAVLMCPGDFEYGPHEELHLLKRLKCSALICGLTVPDAQRERIVTEIMDIAQQKNEEGEAYAKVIITIGETKASINHPKVLKYENLMNESSDPAEVLAFQSKVNAEDPAFACFSSGSTEESKAVVITHHAIINAANLVLPGIYIDGDKRSFSGRPISWGSAAHIAILAIVTGFTYVTTVCAKLTIEDSFKFMFDIISTEQCSGCTIPQDHVNQLLAQNFQDKHDFSQVSAFGFGRQLVPRKTIKALLDTFPEKKAVLVYASTEALMVGILPLSQASISKKEDYGKMYMLPDIEVKIVGDDGIVVPLGTKGEICVRGPKMFLEYLEDPERTSKTKEPTGWVHTSDYGIMYGRARIKVLGRKTDLIDTQNQAVFPVEVEEELLEHPDVQDVVAVGVPNKDQKEDICACVIEVPGSNLEARVDELQKWCDQAFDLNKNLTIPRPAYFLFLKEFPISDAAKIDRRAIKRLANENYRS